MAGTAKNYQPLSVWQSFGNLWLIGVAPTDSAVRLTLAANGTPDSTAHPGSTYMGPCESALTTAVKAKLTEIMIDQADAAVDAYAATLSATIEGTIAQTSVTNLQQLLGVGVYSTGSGYSMLTFGGILSVPQSCLAVISPRRDNPNQYVVSCLYKGVMSSGFTLTLGRSKPSYSKFKFEGLSDITRTAGQQVGVIYNTLVNASGGTPQTQTIDTTQIWEGPVDWWIVSPAPTDANISVLLQASSLTPDTSLHASSVSIGLTNGAATFDVMPKLGMISADQFDAPVDAVVDSLSSKLSGEWSQGQLELLSAALGVSNWTLSAGNYDQATFGGTVVPQEICIAAVGQSRITPTVAAVCCLYKVLPKSGITWAASRKKPSYYKVEFDGMIDLSRTAGRQMGNYWFGTPTGS